MEEEKDKDSGINRFIGFREIQVHIREDLELEPDSFIDLWNNR